MTPSFGLRLYQNVMRVFHLTAPFVLQHRLKAGKEDAARLMERLGQTTSARPQGPIIWFHAASVGESLSALPVIEALLDARKDIVVVITTQTTTSAEILAKRLPLNAIHQFAPIDTPQAIKAFLDHWCPSVFVLIESELWPTLLSTLDGYHIPRLMLSARITEKTFNGWQALKGLWSQLLRGFCALSAQDSHSKARIEQMKAPCQSVHNLKTLGAPLQDNEPERTRLRSQIGQRPIIVCASTHAIEENLIAQALKSHCLNNVILVIVPRHPNRSLEIETDLKALGFVVNVRSKSEPITAKTEIYLADSLGELGLFFRLADLVIMGGSFSQGIGGHNPLEATRLGRFVIHGRDIDNWRSVYQSLQDAKAAYEAHNSQELDLIVTQFLNHNDTLRAAHESARLYNEDSSLTLSRIMGIIDPFLPKETQHGA